MSLANDVDQYDYDHRSVTSPNFIRHFLWFCAGADRQILKHCPQSERIKEEGIGGVVLATAVLAFFSSFYAFYTIFGPKVGFAASAAQQVMDQPTAIKSAIAGFVWACIVFNLDRLIVSSGGNDDGDGSKKFLKALPRLLMAMIIGFTLSKPLEIKVMESEINAKLQLEQQQHYKKLMDVENKNYADNLANINKRKDEVIAARKEKEAALDALRKKANEQEIRVADEASGKLSNKTPGRGPGWQDATDNLQRTLKEKAQVEEDLKNTEKAYLAEVADLNGQIDQAHKDYDLAKKQKVDESHQQDGLMIRISLAHEISPIGSWALTILLLVIEVAPVLYKLMLTNGPFHYLTENQKEVAIARFAIQRKNELLSGNGGEQRTADVYHQADVILDNRVSELHSESRLSEHALKTFEAQIKREIDENPNKFIDRSTSGTA
jgi:hypothetical protein